MMRMGMEEEYKNAIEKKKELLLERWEVLEETRKIEKTIFEMEQKAKEIIVFQVDTKGKPLYSNAEKREIALASVLKENADYKKQLESREEIQKKLSKGEIEIQYLNDMLKYFYAVLRSDTNGRN